MAVSKDNNNCWHYSVYVYNSQGKKIRKRKGNFKSKKEALENERKIINEYSIYDKNSKGQGLATLDQVYLSFFETNKNKKSSTLKAYRANYKNIQRYFDTSLSLNNVTVSMLNDFKNKVVNSEFSIVTKKKILILMQQLYKYAYNLEIIDNNLFNRIGCKFEVSYQDRIENETIKVWSIAQFDTFLKTFGNDDIFYITLFTLLFDTGMRINECLSLTWNDIDFENNTINIHRQYDVNKKAFNSLKTVKSKRIVNYTDHDKTLLIQLKNAVFSHSTYKGDYFLFGGRVPRVYSTVHWMFNNHLNMCDNPAITIHDLRHSHASILFAQGFDITYISKRLGHSNIGTTMNIYTHLIDSVMDTNNKMLDSALHHE